ncbi:MAG: tRNA (N6-isopentenyl adenosine(37)-C2)-methylthiotransferase MiaB, partial [Deltaproteobacteria bacterium]|nr:tRNA (N6-isopentenyl adenosine(37)-C2)-methylthiotransferase MiaB [Deltaproteobacteria bacterium]
PLKEWKDDLILGVCGCVAKQKGVELLKKTPYLDFVLSPDNIPKLAEVVEKVSCGERLALTDFQPADDYEFVDVEPEVENVSAFYTIMKGCDKVCSFCIVPHVRGREISKPSAMIIRELKVLCSRGVKEVTLLGQNVNSYGRDIPGEMDFAELLERLNDIEGLKRLRFVTSHPVDASDRMLSCFGRLGKLCEYLHLPVQSGSDRILEKMRRGYTRDYYKSLIDCVRTHCPGIALSTDIIVGFPGETAADFVETLRLIEEAGFDQIFSFKYSPRPHTAALKYPDDVLPIEKQRRLNAVQELSDSITSKKMASYKGKTLEVLCEGLSRIAFSSEMKAQYTGRTRTNVVVNFFDDYNSVDEGGLAVVRIDESYQHSLLGIRIVR